MFSFQGAQGGAGQPEDDVDEGLLSSPAMSPNRHAEGSSGSSSAFSFGDFAQQPKLAFGTASNGQSAQPALALARSSASSTSAESASSSFPFQFSTSKTSSALAFKDQSARQDLASGSALNVRASSSTLEPSEKGTSEGGEFSSGLATSPQQAKEASPKVCNVLKVERAVLRFPIPNSHEFELIVIVLQETNLSQASTFDTARNEEPLSLQQSSKPPLPQPPAPAGKALLQAAPPAAKSKHLSLFGGKPLQAAANKAGPATGLPKPSAANSKAATTPSSSLKQSLKQAAPFDSSPLAQTFKSPPAQNTLTLAGTVTPVSKRVAEVPEDSLSCAQPGTGNSLAECEGAGGSGSKKNRPDISSVEDGGHKKR
jgi:hypothetical protein